MNAYYIAEGDRVTGPFTEDQLAHMWRNGAITANAMVCLEGTTDWVSIRDEMASMEAMRPKVRNSLAADPVMRMVARSAREKSAGVATLLSLLWPCAGHIYAGEIVAGLGGMVLCFGFLLVGAWPLALVLLIAGILDASGAVRRYNEKLD